MRFFLISVLISLCFLQANARCDSGPDSTKKKETMPNAFKMAPLELLSGDFPFYYERRFTRKFTLLGGLGLTSKDLIWELGRAFNSLDTRTLTDPLVGYSVKLAARVYFSGKKKAMEGAYFEASCSYRYFHSFVSTCNDPTLVGSANPYLAESRNVMDGLLQIGYQVYTQNNFIIDLYFGSGLRYQEGFTVKCIQAPGIGLMPARIHEQKVGPKFSMGICFGFGT